jgi:hypothetical protein
MKQTCRRRKLRHCPEGRIEAMSGLFQDRSKTSSWVYQATALSRFTAELASVFGAATERAGLKLVVNSPRNGAAYRELDARNYIRFASSVFSETAASFSVFLSHLMPLFTAMSGIRQTE